MPLPRLECDVSRLEYAFGIGFICSSVMIVNYDTEGWCITTQCAHGLLASELAARWKFPAERERLAEVLLAIADHDDGEVEFRNEDMLTPQRGPIDFTMQPFNLLKCENLFAITLAKSTLVAWLVSRHMDFLYSPQRDNGEVSAFLATQKSFRTRAQVQLGIAEEKLQSWYALLQWADALSLLLCQQKVPPEQRKIEISKGPGGEVYFLRELSAGTLTVEPWPFVTDSFEVAWESRMVRQMQFDSSLQFRNALLDAGIRVQKVLFRKELPA